MIGEGSLLGNDPPPAGAADVDEERCTCENHMIMMT
jgi:hypothetical protein